MTHTPLQHKPTEDLIAKSLDVAARIHEQETLLASLRRELSVVAKDRYEDSMRVARLEAELVAAKQEFAGKVKFEGELNTRIVEGERLLAKYRREYVDLITSAFNGFPR